MASDPSPVKPIAVTAKVDETLRKHLLARARERCAPVIEDFSKCSSGRTVTVVWTCRTQFNEMNECLHKLYVASYIPKRSRLWLNGALTPQ